MKREFSKSGLLKIIAASAILLFCLGPCDFQCRKESYTSNTVNDYGNLEDSSYCSNNFIIGYEQ